MWVPSTSIIFFCLPILNFLVCDSYALICFHWQTLDTDFSQCTNHCNFISEAHLFERRKSTCASTIPIYKADKWIAHTYCFVINSAHLVQAMKTAVFAFIVKVSLFFLNRQSAVYSSEIFLGFPYLRESSSVYRYYD